MTMMGKKRPYLVRPCSLRDDWRNEKVRSRGIVRSTWMRKLCSFCRCERIRKGPKIKNQETGRQSYIYRPATSWRGSRKSNKHAMETRLCCGNATQCGFCRYSWSLLPPLEGLRILRRNRLAQNITKRKKLQLGTKTWRHCDGREGDCPNLVSKKGDHVMR